jgi:hypothetical protein
MEGKVPGSAGSGPHKFIKITRKLSGTTTSLINPQPKQLGGLGITDRGRFSRDEPRPAMVGSLLPCDESNLDLSRTSTTITLGNGQRASFWSWRLSFSRLYLGRIKLWPKNFKTTIGYKQLLGYPTWSS